MLQSKQYFVYIMTNKSGTLYTGITNNLIQRVYQHKNKLIEGFTKKYRIERLVYYETFTDVYSAIAREKTIKGWLRKRKIELINKTNPEWNDLSKDWFEPDPSPLVHRMPDGTQGDSNLHLGQCEKEQRRSF